MSNHVLEQASALTVREPQKVRTYAEQSVTRFHSLIGRNEYIDATVMEKDIAISVIEIHSRDGVIGWQVTTLKEVA